jgi:hypothetical protein
MTLKSKHTKHAEITNMGVQLIKMLHDSKQYFTEYVNNHMKYLNMVMY